MNNQNFYELSKNDMQKINGGDETVPGGLFWLRDLVVYLFGIKL